VTTSGCDHGLVQVVSARQLNRTVLQRQRLLERVTMPALDVVGHLVGMQAQEPQDPYLGLWSRIARFDPNELSTAIEQREAARIVAMRGTVHLFTAADAAALRPLAQPVLDREMNVKMYREALAGVDLAPIIAAGREILAAGPSSTKALRAALAARFPDVDANVLPHVCRNHLALVQVPPRGLWRRGGQVTYAPVEEWLGREPKAPDVDTVVRRYLAAFGPATNADITTWSGLQATRELTDRMRPTLISYRDERGRELFDLPECELADPDVPAPVRVLPRFDNVLLSHADRDRFFPSPEAKRRLGGEERTISGTILHDGVVVATWRLDRTDSEPAMVLDHAVALNAKVRRAIEREAVRALAFIEPDATGRQVRFAAL
jgi:hypothetical protein